MDIDAHAEREYDPNALPEGTEATVNVVPDDSEELDLAKDQEPLIDDAPVEDAAEDDEPVDGPGTEGV